MRIAFTHNLQRTPGEAEAEFDSPETVAAITSALERLGHDVIPVDVAGSVVELARRLQDFEPDLVFNTAEGTTGRSREAFYPALFAELGLPFTGADAHACLLTLDKRWTKVAARDLGVPTPRFGYADRLGRTLPEDLRFPLLVKPNFEGSSKGIGADAIVRDAAALDRKLEESLRAWPDGVLVEEFVPGRDVVVSWLEAASPETGGVLPAAEYRAAGGGPAGDPWAIHEFRLKHDPASGLQAKSPAALPPDLARTIADHSRRLFEGLRVRDLGRIDWRVTPDGLPSFLEVNALPSLDPGSAIYASARVAGIPDLDSVLALVVRSAALRFGLDPSKKRAKRKRPVRVGFSFNLKRVRPGLDGKDDHEAEYDSQETIDAIADAIAAGGHEVVKVEADRAFSDRIAAAHVDVVFNMAEGLRGRSREALVPAILELLDIPHTGSDAVALAVTLDKAIAKRLVRDAGVPTAPFAVVTAEDQPLPPDLRFPLMVKPVAEGSSKGVGDKSVATDEASLKRIVRDCLKRYGQGVLVEGFLPGREFTVGLLGGPRPRALPPMEIRFAEKAGPLAVYSFARKLSDASLLEVPAKVDPDLGREIEEAAVGAFMALGCRDVARVDLRCDENGRVCFIECNPLPGLTPGWSDLCLIAEAAGMSYKELIAAILAPALDRHRRRGSSRRRGAKRT